MPTSDMIILLLIVAAFTLFAVVLAWVSRREPQKRLTNHSAADQSPSGARHA